MQSDSVKPASYDPAYFGPLFAVEDRHFWFRARNRIISTLVKQLTAPLSPDCRVLEIGCGTGNVLQFLEQACPGAMVIGMDLFAEGLQYARRRVSCALVQGDIYKPPFGIQFDLIGLFDVLEHLPDDIQMLQALYNMIRPGGTLLLTVPAYQSLWSYFDQASHHCRRYHPVDLREKLGRVGFRVEYLTPYMASIFPLVWLGRRLASIANRRDADTSSHVQQLAMRELRVTPVVNELLTWLLFRECTLIARRCRLPVGTSLLAVAHVS
jgi:SAM-dependent methyltransferase